MLDFSGNDEKAKLVAVHYAKVLGNMDVQELIENDRDITNQEEALTLAKFFWEMLDASARDKENGVVVLDETDLQFWMERLMNIIGGYLKKIGYEEEWNKVCDQV